MRILLTGGTGLIGRQLCRVLRERGYELTVLSRKPATVATKCGAGVHAWSTLAEWKPTASFDAVINLAGEPIADKRWTRTRKRALLDSRVVLTEELVNRIAAAERKPKVLLSGSAVGYYGDRGDTVLSEREPPGSDFSAQLCQAWEAAAASAETMGVRVCMLRTGLVLSNQGGLLGQFLPPFRMGMGFRVGNGRQWMSWIHIDDYVAIVERMLNDDQCSGPYNMTAPNPAANAEFAVALGRVLHRPAWRVLPSALLRLGLGERATLLLGGQRVVPARLRQTNFKFGYDRLEDALRELL
jgi:uncharacterized protein